MLSENGLPIAELERLGFTATRPAGPKEVLNGFDLDAVRANLFLLLETASFSGTSFVDFADQTIEVERDGIRYIVFGAQWRNAYLIEIETGVIRLVQTTAGYKKILFVNTDLRRFVRCFCFFQSLAQNYVATFILDEESQQKDVAALRQEAMSAALRTFVADVDPAALESDETHVWALTVYELADLGIMFFQSILYYMERGRFRPP